MTLRLDRLLPTCLILDLVWRLLALDDISISLNHSGPVIESHQYRLQCHIPNMVQATSVKWYKNQSVVHQETLIGIRKTPELTIVPNRTDDGAQYICEAELNVGSASSKHISIQVFYVSITTVNPNGPMIESHQYRLQCHIPSEVEATSVKWYKNQSVVHQETLIGIRKTPELTIVPNRTDDGAQYRCEAELNVGSASSKHISIQVFYVSITTVNPNGPMIEFHQYRLQCHIPSEVEAMSVKWYKNLSLVHQETLIGIRKTPELTIVPNRTDNGAQYRCEAELNVGSASSKHIRIQVFYVSITTVNPNGPMIESHQYRLQCHIPSVVQATSVKWYKDQSVVHQETLIGIRKTPELTIVPNRTDDGAQYRCEAELNVGSASSKHISIQIFYVSITTVNPNGPMIEFREYRLQCHIPSEVEATNVKWYKDQSVVHQETLIGIRKTPELSIVPNRTDDGAQYRCEAELNVGSASSKHISIQVFFKPTINGTSLPIKVPVFRGYPLVLVCEAEGNPKPTVSWSQTDSAVNGGNLTITELISQNPVCTAVNSVGSTSRNIIVVPTEDYLPLIAGLVAITVAIISVIFIFIYSIYYKTAKMGHYSLKDAKPSPENGNIAQNGKDNPLHMKKLSQSDILAYPSVISN